ncbi:hypothetical protein FE392_16475 [Xenorhabdus sp. 12]|uniref:Uncharacterized protein n=1 Tax=Xenorhabdus santafensis TaxID=2582833 RepID=A0ABU4SDU9_9GAMM|nr:hypothetical protein [Xenorhabdus sp. 12]MDX7988901.1 hypothetical protein [Xenorhabdus sp. 12]
MTNYVMMAVFITTLNALYMPKALCISKALSTNKASCTHKSSCITKVLCKKKLCKNARQKKLTKTLNSPASHHNALTHSLSKSKNSRDLAQNKNNNDQKACTKYQMPPGWGEWATKNDLSEIEDFYVFKDDKGDIQVKIVPVENDDTSYPLMPKDLLIIKNNQLKQLKDWMSSIIEKII